MRTEARANAREDNTLSWGQQALIDKYGTHIQKLLRFFTQATRSTITIRVNTKLLFLAPAEGNNYFCQEIRKLPWGDEACRRDEIEWAKKASLHNGNVQKFVCHMGLENHVSSFNIAGLGDVVISLTRLTPEGSFSPRKAIAEAMQAGFITPEDSRLLMDAWREEIAVGDPLAQPFKSLFVQMTRLIRNLLESGIASSLLARSVLHEISISLAGTSGAAEYLLDKTATHLQDLSTETSERISDCIRTVSEQVQIARYLSQNLLEYYSPRGEESATMAATVPFPLQSELIAMCNIWERIAKQKGIEIHYEFGCDDVIAGDPIQLRQLFHNLLSNAIKYSYSTSEKGETRFIHITCGGHDPGFREKRVGIHISNYGVGILEDEIPLLGQPGFRGRLAVQEHPIGLGIGVFMAKEIARRHGGEIKYKCDYLHDSVKPLRGKSLETKTYRIEVSVILPTIDGKGG